MGPRKGWEQRREARLFKGGQEGEGRGQCELECVVEAMPGTSQGLSQHAPPVGAARVQAAGEPECPNGQARPARPKERAGQAGARRGL